MGRPSVQKRGTTTMSSVESVSRFGVGSLPATAAAERVTTFLRGVNGWLFVVAPSRATTAPSASIRPLLGALMPAQLGMVFGLRASVTGIAPATASLLFVAYSALTGVTLSFVLLVFTGASVATAFVVTAG